MKSAQGNDKSEVAILASQILLRVAVVICVIELLIMLVFESIESIGLTFDPGYEALLDSATLTLFSSPLIYLWVIRPFVLQRDEAIDRIHHLAYHDELTGLGNRRLLGDLLRRVEVGTNFYQQCGALLLIDLDGFKQINDRYGHDAGDEVLREVSRRLKAITRANDVVCRLGGDEFVVIAKLGRESDPQIYAKCQVVARKLLLALDKPVVFDNQLLKIGASIGVRLVGDAKDNVHALLREADQAMYLAKRQGKGRVAFFETDLHRERNIHPLRA